MAKVVGIDTCILMYVLEDNQAYAQKASRVLRMIASGKYEGIFSIIGMIELLTGPKKHGRDDVAVQYEQILQGFKHLSITNLNERIVWLASDLRAKYGIRTPDAIHVATAIDAGATSFITNDKTLQRVREIRVKLL